MNTEYTIYKAG